jgi:hypothetical protein
VITERDLKVNHSSHESIIMKLQLALTYVHIMGVAADSLLSLLDSLVLVMDGGGVYNR